MGIDTHHLATLLENAVRFAEGRKHQRLVLFASPLAAAIGTREINNGLLALWSAYRSEVFGEARLKALAELKTIPADAMLPVWFSILEKTQSPRMKREIIEHLSRLHDKRIIIPLAKELSNPHNDVRKSAAFSLKNNNDDRIYPYILSLATSPNPVFRIYFIEAMNYLYDRRFYEMLINLLKDPNKSVRIYVLNCLRSNNLNESLPLIRNIALYDSNDEVKINAIDAIGHFRDTNSQYVLLKTINENNRDVRLATARTLHKLSLANSAYPLSQRLSVETEEDIKDMILEALIRVRNGGNITGLSRILISDTSENLRIKAAFALGVIRDQRAISILLQGLDDSSYRVRAEAANSLGLYKNPAVIAKLTDVVAKDHESYVRSAALYSLKRINERKSAVQLFDIYAKEQDPLFKELLRGVIREFMSRYL